MCQLTAVSKKNLFVYCQLSSHRSTSSKSVLVTKMCVVLYMVRIAMEDYVIDFILD